MNIKTIKLTNFKCFKGIKFAFDPMTLIRGKNGVGKTTATLEALLYTLYGYTTKELLSDLPTRGVSKSCAVEVEFTRNNHTYIVKRAYPSKLFIIKDGSVIKFNTTAEGNTFLTELVGSREYFQKFRVIDKAKESNLLEQGNVALKRIIFAGSDEIFNNMRVRLLEIKRKRELLNKDRVKVSSHYPSEKRLSVVTNKMKELEEQETDLIKTIREFETDFRKTERETGKLENEKVNYNNRKNILNRPSKKCYACEQLLPIPKAKEMLEEANKKIKEINNSLATKNSEIKEMKDLINSHRTIKGNISNKLQTLFELRNELESRLKMKDFIYTNKDEEIVKQAVKELDNISSYYLTKTVKTLTPIINSILQKINFTISFNVNNKGKFAIELQKPNAIYKYKDLSCGEKIMLQIAFKLAILLQNNDTGIIVADEGFASLDEDNLRHILEIFEGLPFQLLLVLHHAPDLGDNIKTIDLNNEKQK